jgi:hypothetical protein
MLCPNCKQPVPDGARFCGGCGKAISPPAEVQGTLIRPPAGGAGAIPGGPSATAAGAGFAGTAGPLPGIFDRIKNMLLNPKTEWQVIEPEQTPIAKLYMGYIGPLVAVSALVSFVHSSLIGYSIPFVGRFRVPIEQGLVSAVVGFVFMLIGVFLAALIIDFLAPTFSGQKNQAQALKTAAYSYTPGFVGAVLYPLPLGTLIALAAALYGIYVLYLGLPVMMKSPREKAVGYTAAVIICGIVLGILFGIVMSVVGIGRYGYGGMGGFHGTAMTATPEQQQQQGAAILANIIGNAAGSDQKSKEAMANALNGVAQVGRDAEAQANANATANNANGISNGSNGATNASANPQDAARAGANLLAALGGAMSGGRHVDPVDFHALKDMLPASLPGMERTNAEGNSGQAMGMKGSSATGQYQGSGTRAEIKITDASAVAGLMDLATSVQQNTASESDNGFEKNTVIAGRAVHEKYDIRSKHGELNVIVAKRFTVDVTGDGVDVATLESYAASIDYSKLDAMKDVGAHAAQ